VPEYRKRIRLALSEALSCSTLQRENAEQVVGEMPTDGFQVIGRRGVQQQPNSLADRLVAAEFIEELNDEIGVERRIKLVHHENSPCSPSRLAWTVLVHQGGEAIIHKRDVVASRSRRLPLSFGGGGTGCRSATCTPRRL
jgi:hypothetical protein